MPKLNEIVRTGAKKHGEGTYMKGDQCRIDFPRIPTGVFALDYSLGGGFPVGVTSSVYGPPSGGKTLVMTRIAAGAQKICWNCYDYLWDCKCKAKREQKVVIVQTELFDIGWASQLGLDPEKVVIAEPSSGEQASDIIIECLRADDCGLVLLDSLPMLTPIIEMEASALDVQVAAQAKLISKLIRRVKTQLIREKKKHHPVAFICTNQIRAKIGGFQFGPSEEVPGGFTSKHDWHLSIRMSQLKSENIDKRTSLPIDAKFKGSMAAMGNKRKVFTLSGSAEFYVTVSDGGNYFRGTINDFKSTMRYAEEGGQIGKDPWYFAGKTFEKKADIFKDWLDEETFLSAKKYIVDHYIRESKDELTAVGITTVVEEPLIREEAVA